MQAIEELCTYPHIEEAAVLSTCNRMELYVVALSWHRGVAEVGYSNDSSVTESCAVCRTSAGHVGPAFIAVSSSAVSSSQQMGTG